MANQETKHICFNCKHWSMEPGEIDKKHLDLARGMVTPDNLKDVPLVYGKCNAPFVGTNSVPQEYDDGSASWNNCFAVDLEGNQLFAPVPKE